MEAVLISTTIVAFVTAGVIKGAIGVGLPTTAIAILGTVLGLREAVVLLIVPSLVANVWQVTRGGDLAGLLRRFWLLNAAACLGIWLGTMILFRVDPTLLSGLLGLVVTVYALMNLLAFEPRLHSSRERAWAPGVGLLAGLLTGTTGSLLLPVVVYLQALGLEKDRFVQAVGLSLLIGTIAWAAALVNQGAVDRDAILLSAFALVPTLAGMAAGIWVRDRISQLLFRRIIFVALLILGANLVYGAVS